MSLSGAEIRAVADELAALAGARVQRVYVPGLHTLLLDLRLPGRSLLLLLETEPGLARAGLVQERPPSPSHPFSFQGLLRAHLTGARVDRLDARPEERVLQLLLSTDGGPRLLLAELRPREGRLVLAQADGTILGVSPGGADGGRALERGAVWTPPDALPEGAVRPELAAPGPDFPASRAVEALYRDEQSQHRLDTRRAQLLPRLRAARKKLARTLEKVRGDLARVGEADRYRQLGDLLKPELHRLKRGAVTAKVIEYAEEGPREVEVPLLPHLSAKENMERYYHLHRRLARSADLVAARERSMTERLARADDLLARAEAATDAAVLDDVAAEARRAGLRSAATQRGPAAPGAPAARVPYREYKSATGRRILVGRSAEDNDALTFRHARGNDQWLHARGVTGSHVVIPTAEGDADGETLLDAATLAVHFSAAKEEAAAEVSVTRCKFVRKGKDAPPGSVRYSQERTLLLRMEPARRARLLQGAEGAEPPNDSA
jgi:predicted ribosome quality control (RQC) complex YloA/Tae2 family protein